MDETQYRTELPHPEPAVRWLEEPLVNSVVVDPDGTRNQPHPYEPLGEGVSDGFCRRCGRDSRHELHACEWSRGPGGDPRCAEPSEARVRFGPRHGHERWYCRGHADWLVRYSAGTVVTALDDETEDANSYPVLELPPGTDVVRFEPGRRLRLVLRREGAP